MSDVYEAKHEHREMIIDMISKLTSEEPWSGYDGQGVPEITARLAGRGAATARKVRAYEGEHKDRAGVLDAAARHTVS